MRWLMVSPVLVLIGSAAIAGDALRARTPTLPLGLPGSSSVLDDLVSRGRRRWAQWRIQISGTDTVDQLAHHGPRWARHWGQWWDGSARWWRDNADELPERAEEVLAYAALYRWRLRRIPDHAARATLHRLNQTLISPITHPHRPRPETSRVLP